MKPDLQNRPDITKVVTLFYEKIVLEPELGPFFSHWSADQWGHHVHVMTDFWENVLFYTGEYSGDPLKTHRSVNAIKPTRALHFERWLQLFNQTIDDLYEGPNASKMKIKARGIAAIMLEKAGTA